MTHQGQPKASSAQLAGTVARPAIAGVNRRRTSSRDRLDEVGGRDRYRHPDDCSENDPGQRPRDDLTNQRRSNRSCRRQRISAPGPATTLNSRLVGVSCWLGTLSTLSWKGSRNTAPDTPTGLVIIEITSPAENLSSACDQLTIGPHACKQHFVGVTRCPDTVAPGVASAGLWGIAHWVADAVGGWRKETACGSERRAARTTLALRARLPVGQQHAALAVAVSESSCVVGDCPQQVEAPAASAPNVGLSARTV